ncbi:PREDICTED: placenta-specific protein 1 [Miniopterus natalensis]|uniref:placenta-specific protein 1 n=1 Tax=Miniopterus natalensis TaxID=291302 RepID=UPI0007A6E928|nr:PREDICTED: placenta-specific protein 1 [Miniopterus natalensis]
MKVFTLIGGMVILTSLFLACFGQNPITVLCSIDWFMVMVHPLMLNSNVCVHFHELHLGLGCPVNHVQSHMYKFTYRVTECGIRAKAISQEMVMYSTEIHYASKSTSSKYTFPVSCTASQYSPWLTAPYSMKEVSEIETATQDGETGYKVFTLSQFSQRPKCNCPPCVFNEGEHTQAPYHQAGAQKGHSVQSSFFVDISEDWSLCSICLSPCDPQFGFSC